LVVLKKCTALLLILCVLFVFGCSTHIHKVGDGAQGSAKETGRQWYILFGLVPLNNVDSNAMAGGAESYTVQTQASAIDVIIGFFTGIVTINARTVTVTK
jgi:hypothetical protein